MSDRGDDQHRKGFTSAVGTTLRRVQEKLDALALAAAGGYAVTNHRDA